MALARTWVSCLACPGSQQGFGPKPDFKFGMPGLSTWLWPELGFQVWHARAFNINMALVRTQVSSLECPRSQQVWHARAPNRALARSRVSSLACPGSQHGFGPNLGFMFGMPGLSTGLWPEAGFQVWHARALNMALARTWVSSMACPGFHHQHGFGANAGFKFGMPGLSTGLACPVSQQGFGPKQGFKFGMPGLPTWLWPEPGFMFGMPGLSTELWPEAGFHVWHARALNMALARTWVSSLACLGFQHQHGFGANAGFKFGMPGLSTGLACPGSQQGFGPKPGFKFGMPGLPTWLWPEPGFHVWHARAPNRALARSRVSSLACPSSQHGFGPNLGFMFGMPGLSTSTWLWCERRFQVWHARALNRFGMPGLPTWLWPEAGFQVWHARAPNMALARTWVSCLACPGSQHGFGPNLGFKFGMPGLSTSTWLWCERRFQVWHARAHNRFGMPGLPTGLWPEAGFQVWHARAPNMALARTWVSCLTCPGSQQGFGPKPDFRFGMPGLSTWLSPELGFQVWHARAFNINMALVRTWFSSLACPGFQHQHGFGANAGFKFGMPGLSTGLARPGSQQGFGPKPGFKFGMPGLPTWPWPEPGFHVWHARALNRALARSRISSLACPGSQHGFGPNLGFKFGMPGLSTSTWLWCECRFQVWHARALNRSGMPGLSTGLWPGAGFQVWHARALNMTLARTRVSSLACPGFQHQHGFGANAGFKFGMPGLPTGLWPEAGSSSACPGSQHGFGPNLGFMFGVPGLSTWLWPEAGFQVWHARALNMALARTWVSSLACPGFQHQHGFGANAGFKFGMPGLSQQVWHARAPNKALARSRVSSLACPGSQHGFGPNLGFMFGMPGLSTGLWPEAGFQVWHARALHMALARTWVSSLACPGFQHQHGIGANAGFKFGMFGLSTDLACPGSQQGFGPKPGFKFGMPGLPTWLWPEPGFHVWHARALNRALVRTQVSSLACPGSQHGFGPNLGFKFGMPGLSTSTWLWCERRFQVWHARALNRFGMPGLPTGLWPEAGFQVWHARAPNMALARTWVSCLACLGSQLNPKP